MIYLDLKLNSCLAIASLDTSLEPIFVCTVQCMVLLCAPRPLSRLKIQNFVVLTNGGEGENKTCEPVVDFVILPLNPNFKNLYGVVYDWLHLFIHCFTHTDREDIVVTNPMPCKNFDLVKNKQQANNKLKIKPLL